MHHNIRTLITNLKLESPPTRAQASLAAWLVAALVVLAQLARPIAAEAATVWTGPVTNFTDVNGSDPTQAANQDQLTPNVWITRGSSAGIYNAKTEFGYTHNFSPADTEWADGTTASYSSLSYTNWEHGPRISTAARLTLSALTPFCT